MQIPKLDKIVVNVGAGDAKDNTKVIDTIIAELSADHRTESRFPPTQESPLQTSSSVRA